MPTFPFGPAQGSQSAAVGTATSDDVLTGYTFSSAAAGLDVAGTMPNQGAFSLNSGNSAPGVYTSAAGYYSGVTVIVEGWITEASDTTARSELAAVYDSSSNLTYAIDGYNGSDNLTTVTAYSAASNSWTAEADDTTARSGLAAVYDSSSNLTYAIDGGNSSGVLTTVTGFVY
jgi:hypothetical protein